MRPRTHPQVYRWSGQSQFIEEDLAHLGVVMLAGVDDFLLDQRWNALPRLTTAALINCGRAPTTVKIRRHEGAIVRTKFFLRIYMLLYILRIGIYCT